MSTMEQTMLGFGSGLSKAGFIPIIHSITPFLILRALEQIKIDFVYNKQNTKGWARSDPCGWDHSGTELRPYYHHMA